MSTNNKHKFDIFAVLNKISAKDKTFYNALSEEEQKAIAPLIIMRWMSGTKSIRQIIFLNELVNPLVFSLSKHKPLLLSLMSLCTNGQTQRYAWNKTKSNKTTSYPNTIGVIREYFGYNTMQAKEVLPILTTETVISFAEELGKQPDEIRAIKKELKDRERTTIPV
jgi:hypothetical protein